MKQLNVPAEIEKILSLYTSGPEDFKAAQKHHVLSLIGQLGKEIIGEDEDDQKYVTQYSENNAGHDQRVRNQLKAAQRQTLNALLKGRRMSKTMNDIVNDTIREGEKMLRDMKTATTSDTYDLSHLSEEEQAACFRILLPFLTERKTTKPTISKAGLTGGSDE